MIVGKAVKMCKMMNVNLLGLVENMAYMICPCCNNPIYPFGPSKINEVAESFDMRPLASLAINPTLASYVDAGKIEDADVKEFDNIAAILEKLL